MSKTKWNAFKKGVSKRSPQILTALAIAEFAATLYFAVKATPKAEKLIEEATAEKGEKLTVLETVKVAGKCYIPATVMGICTIATMIGVNSAFLKQTAALETAYNLTKSSYATYKDKVIETIGEKKDAAIEDAIAQDNLNQIPVVESKVIDTGEGTTLFRDWASGRDFLHDRNKIESACNRLNHQMLTDMTKSLNDLYAELGLDDVGVGALLGWNINATGLIEPVFSPGVASNGQPCFILRFPTRREPIPNYEYC